MTTWARASHVPHDHSSSRAALDGTRFASPPCIMDLTMKDVMTAQPVTIGRDQTLATAHALMREHHCRHLPVLEQGELVGILSQRDLYFLETIKGVESDVDLVEDAMSS